MFENQSIITTTDSYKFSHFNQYPPNVQNLFAYGEARRTKNPDGIPNYTVFAGMQLIIDRHLSTPVTAADINHGRELARMHGVPFNEEGWQKVLRDHNGFLPLQIRAVEEGSVVPNGNVLWTVTAADGGDKSWVTYVETALLRLWYPCTVAALSYEIKKVLMFHMGLSCDNLDGLPFKLHDFGARGVSSSESAGIGGLAHLFNFKGTDTVEALLAAAQHYHEPCAGLSIPAMEHSTVTSWGRDGEEQAFLNMMQHYAKPGAVLACVSDSYDIYHATEHIWGGSLRDEVIKSGATIVIRPDSGAPEDVLPALMNILGDKFGFTTNSKGYKVLNGVRLIWSDGIDSANEVDFICAVLITDGWSIDNIAFGMGGGLLQKVNRDTLSFAYKVSAKFEDGAWHDVYKEPITDPGKNSKRGLLTLVRDGDKFETRSGSINPSWGDQVRPALNLVYDCGRNLGNRITLEQARKNTGLW